MGKGARRREVEGEENGRDEKVGAGIRGGGRRKRGWCRVARGETNV